MRIKIDTVRHPERLVCADGESELNEALFLHCTGDIFDHILLKDNKDNRKLVTGLLRAHGVTEVIFNYNK